MIDPRRHAAALVAVLALTAPVAARAQGRALGSPPPLTAEPPHPLSGDKTPGPEPTVQPPTRSDLPNTGARAGLMVLLGLGLLASGSGLRVTLATDRGHSV